MEGKPKGYDEWAVLPGQGLYYNPDFLTPMARSRRRVIAPMSSRTWRCRGSRKSATRRSPSCSESSTRPRTATGCPRRAISGPLTTSSFPSRRRSSRNIEGQASPSRNQELEIDRHMDLNYDLFVDLTAEFDQPASQKTQDRSAWMNMKRMTPSSSRPGTPTLIRKTSLPRGESLRRSPRAMEAPALHAQLPLLCQRRR
jgi:hypothetical protein